jgi:hypothetical protein
VALSCEQYYQQLHQSCGDVLTECFAYDHGTLQAGAHQFVSDLSVWREVLSDRPECGVFSAGLSEYQFSLLAVAFGQYRQAFMSLRLTFELFLGSVHYSANEFKLRQWMKGRQDLVWSSLIDIETGVFSKSFVNVFFEDLADSARQYGAIAESVYRECSEYVHGNASTHSSESATVTFQPQTFETWHEKAKSVRLACSFALCARYLLILDTAKRAKLEPILLDSLGHIASVRGVFGAPVEQING